MPEALSELKTAWGKIELRTFKKSQNHTDTSNGSATAFNLLLAGLG